MKATICQHNRQYVHCGDCWNNRCELCLGTLDAENVCLEHGKRTFPREPLGKEKPQPFGPPAKAKLCKLSLCHCGYPLLREEITLGTEYTVYPASLEPTEVFMLICGGCGGKTVGYGRILACSIHNPAAAPTLLPVGIFDLELETWPEVIDA